MAATILAKYDATATMAVVTADQVLEPPEVLQNALRDAFRFVNDNPDASLSFGFNVAIAGDVP